MILLLPLRVSPSDTCAMNLINVAVAWRLEVRGEKDLLEHPKKQTKNRHVCFGIA